MEWMGHRDLATTLVYADYAPDPAQGASFAKLAFGEASPAASLTAGAGWSQRRTAPRVGRTLASGRPDEH